MRLNLRAFALVLILCALGYPARSQSYIRVTACGDPRPPAGASSGYQDINGNICTSTTAGGGSSVQAFPPVTTYQGTMTLSAATSTSLIAANVTMAPNSAALPAAGAFARLVIIAPGTGCAFTINWHGGTATATSGEQFGGANLSSDTVNLTGQANAPTLFSTAGCPSPSLVQFHN